MRRLSCPPTSGRSWRPGWPSKTVDATADPSHDHPLHAPHPSFFPSSTPLEPSVSGAVYIRTFGCQMNAYDSGRMLDLLAESRGYAPVEDPAAADLIILNTCHVREKAEEKLFSELGRLKKLTAGRRVIFAVGGCVGQTEGRLIFKRAPYVDLVFGPQNYHRLPDFLTRLEQGESRLWDVDIPTEAKFDELPAVRSAGPIGSVTVQEGCDKFCTYCVVPFTRGREWSRSVERVVEEVEGLVRQGAVEIQLLGQNVNAYQSLDREGVVHDLALLIRRVALIDGVRRLRFITSHPADMNADLVEVFADVPQLAPYLHLPIQSGSDRILQAMGRGHTAAEYLAWVERLRAACPDLALASDFIVGFPGETEADFQDTLNLAERVGYDHAYSFKYSARPGTQAAQLPDPVPEPEIAARLARLQKVLERHQLAGNRRQVGRVEEVLVEGPSRPGSGELAGRDGTWRKVNFPGPESWIGTLVPVRIVEGMPNSLRGVPVVAP
ncbi:MAG: tRNA (N6-isopentenyl adenosine(37)-C2)-methylthiotransferase MiaB [Magnetococcales bacterium]|nr:tRNA (N6-isopentenyl adenosine(37)-C2)-methylthiotransferase MiaB [Magnetococcales bacterium]